MEFIIALTDHRYLGKVFQPFFIRKKEKFYTVEQFVTLRDLKEADYNWRPWEEQLVKLTGKYSDEVLRKKFSRTGSVSEFFSTLDTGFFEKQVSPFIEKVMMDIVSVLMLSPVKLFKKEANYSNLYEEDIIKVSPFYASPEFYFERSELHTKYTLKLFLESREIVLSKRTVKIITNNPCLIIYRGQMVAIKGLHAKKLIPFLEKDFISVPNTIEDKYYSGFILKAVRDFDVKAEGFEIRESDAEKRAVLSFEKNLQYVPSFILKFEYGEDSFLQQSKKRQAVELKKKSGTFIFSKTVRDLDWEKSMIQIVEEFGLKEDNGYYLVEGTELLVTENALYFMINWLNENKQALTKKGFIVRQDKLEKNYYTGKQKLDIQTTTKGDWFDVYAVVEFGEFKIPFIRLKNHILNDIREFELPNGKIAVLPEEWFARFKGILPFGKQKGERIKFEKHHFTLLKEVVQERDKTFNEHYRKLLNGNKEDIVLPLKLKAKMRNYQEAGYSWMFGLYKNGLGGCLADDMGLGKTLQTLTLLLKLKRKKQELRIVDPVEGNNKQLDLFADQRPVKDKIQPASLIVVPTSLVHNWENEIKKFTPSLKVYRHVGAQRKKAADLEQLISFYDIIITSYGTVRNDREILSKAEFFYVILDESQAIKNSASKTYKAVTALNAKYRLVITGTPIENSLSDLWSQMNFLNPGMLGNLPFFRNTFITPIEKHGILEQQEKLQVMIRPFVLRRKKIEVATDLPPLMEETRLCPMGEEQAKMYEEEKSVIRNTILSAIASEGINKSHIVVLQGLTKLRQLANHPTLFKKESTEESGKFDEIFRMLENLVAEKHKVLIFSSFVKHLELLEGKIEDQNWKYSKLTGQTTRRENVIKQFQEDKENRIFLISLKAGGVGLNLTEADYVFIIDPWWNPAAENQAINRAHRIGQNKNVFVYRFITENSIEEKIQKMKERKSSLADKFINSNNPFKKITQEEIVELFT